MSMFHCGHRKEDKLVSTFPCGSNQLHLVKLMGYSSPANEHNAFLQKKIKKTDSMKESMKSVLIDDNSLTIGLFNPDLYQVQHCMWPWPLTLLSMDTPRRTLQRHQLTPNNCANSCKRGQWWANPEEDVFFLMTHKAIFFFFIFWSLFS